MTNRVGTRNPQDVFVCLVSRHAACNGQAERVAGDSFMAPVGWGKASLLAIPWALAGALGNILLWVFGPAAFPPGYFLLLLVPPCLMAALGGFLHRSPRVAL